MAEIWLKVFVGRAPKEVVKLSTALIAIGVALILIPLPVPIPFVGALAVLAGLFVRLFGV